MNLSLTMKSKHISKMLTLLKDDLLFERNQILTCCSVVWLEAPIFAKALRSFRSPWGLKACGELDKLLESEKRNIV